MTNWVLHSLAAPETAAYALALAAGLLLGVLAVWVLGGDAVSSTRSAAPAAPSAVSTKRRPRNVLIVGAGQRGLALAERMRRHPEYGRRVVGFVEDDPGVVSRNGFKVLGTTDDIMALAERHAVDEIVVAYAPSWQERLLRELVTSGRDERLHVKVLPSLYEAVIGELPSETIEDIPLLRVNGRKASVWYSAGKRTTDVLLSAALLILSAPFVVLAALAVKATSRGPVLFRQRRVGLGGREFTIYKLRTMVLDAESDTGPVLASADDGRATPVGRLLRRTRLDEFPQLFNVLRGEMSLVGPRPERPEFVARYAREIEGYRKRLEVRPGLTGLAQVRGGYLTSVYDKLKYDWMYVYKRSLWLDLKILWLTVGVVVSRSGY